MIHVKLTNPDPQKWQTSENVSVRGDIFYNNVLYKGNSFANLMSKKNISTLEKWSEELNQVNGFFAIVKRNTNTLFAAVDRIRSIPLFYGQKNNNFYLSDDARWVRDQLRDEAYEELAKIEFLLTGYVTGSDTLYPNVKQLQAGEALFVEDNPNNIYITTHRYYRYLHENYLELSEQELLQLLDETLLNIFKRLIHWAGGRPIIVPLSGGYDSRLIVTMLKRLGYKNVIAFSYGRPGNKESAISEQVARSLRIKWEFIPYSNEAWFKWYRSNERSAYFRMAHGLSSVPVIQDWPAVWELKLQGKLLQDAVFVPGHSGDFLAGSHIPAEFMLTAKVGMVTFIKAIFNKHYCLWDWEKYKKDLGPVLQKRIIRLTETNNFETPDQAANAFEKWDWQERQAKFIVNSVRAYEFWGYDWYLPLWDAEIMEFWSRIGLKWRVNQKLYMKYVTSLYAGITNSSEKNARKRDDIGVGLLLYKKLRRALMSSNIDKYLVKYLPFLTQYMRHPLCWYGIMDKRQFYRLYTARENINTFLALDILGRITIE